MFHLTLVVILRVSNPPFWIKDTSKSVLSWESAQHFVETLYQRAFSRVDGVLNSLGTCPEHGSLTMCETERNIQHTKVYPLLSPTC